jgi:hypothetical protein
MQLGSCLFERCKGITAVNMTMIGYLNDDCDRIASAAVYRITQESVYKHHQLRGLLMPLMRHKFALIGVVVPNAVSVIAFSKHCDGKKICVPIPNSIDNPYSSYFCFQALCGFNLSIGVVLEEVGDVQTRTGCLAGKTGRILGYALLFASTDSMHRQYDPPLMNCRCDTLGNRESEDRFTGCTLR